jgi:N-acetylglucosamine kinase-like BadF-type ATPase
MPDYYIAVDGGSTTSVGLLATSDRRVLHRVTAGCANYHLVGLRGTEKTLLTIIESLASAAGVSPREIEGFCFALSGVSRTRDFKNIEGLLRRHRIHKKSKIISDFEAALLGGTRKEAGVVIISGTGSVVFGRNERGETKKVGGHGHLIGDPGSGYDIGIRALRAIIAASEGRGEKTKLTGEILRGLSLSREEDIIPWLYSAEEPKVAVARLAPLVISVAEKGDGVANKILHSAVRELADIAAFAAEHLRLTAQTFDVVLSGGVFGNNPQYFRLMKSVLSERIIEANPMGPENEPVFGALVALLGHPARSLTDGPEQNAGTKDG